MRGKNQIKGFAVSTGVMQKYKLRVIKQKWLPGKSGAAIL